MFYYCKCSVAVSHGAVGWSAVRDCGIPDHIHLLYVSEAWFTELHEMESEVLRCRYICFHINSFFLIL